jgi:hypothetical protein
METFRNEIPRTSFIIQLDTPAFAWPTHCQEKAAAIIRPQTPLSRKCTEELPVQPLKVIIAPWIRNLRDRANLDGYRSSYLESGDKHRDTECLEAEYFASVVLRCRRPLAGLINFFWHASDLDAKQTPPSLPHSALAHHDRRRSE